MESINPSNAPSSQSGEQIYVSSPKHKKIGFFLIIVPWIGLIVVLLLFSILNMVLKANIDSSINEKTLAVFNFLLTIFGFICFLGIIFGIPLSIIFFKKKVLADGVRYDARSGKKEQSEIPLEIKGWNWGAAGLTLIWGLYHNVWISLLSLLPVVNIVIIIVLGLKGNEWAWQAQKWQSVEQFKTAQKKWKPWGIAFFIFMVIGFISKGLKMFS
ncbi:hypothetical protein HYV57_02655 [Candidatus Peregrinibacteria bacterium]|nr:hypothetical protein [Candidatus Peregrinibacteria bacterium]